MRRKNPWLLAAAAMALAVVLAFFARSGVERSSRIATSELPESSSSSAAATPAFAAKARHARTAGPEVADDRPFAEIRPDLERRANSGDAEAARRLGKALANCNDFVPISDEQIENIVVEDAAKGVSVRQNGRQLAPEEMLSTLQLLVAQRNRDCKNISGLNETDANRKAFHWIERGAALGDADAQALYGALAFMDFNNQTALGDAEQIRDRKQLATSYLQASLAQGDAMALLQLSSQYDAGRLFQHDPEMAYAYLYAYSLTTRASDVVPELLAQLLAARAGTLDPAALERARNEGLQLATCCEMTDAPATP
jgi:TPR repeat protein